MPATPLRCVAIVPFLDEERHLPDLLASVDAQTRRPDRLVLVDDGSRDGSAGIAREFALRRPWLRILHRPQRAPGRDRLEGAPELAAFLWACEQLAEPWDVVVKLDADLRLAPEHFATVLAAMEGDPRLGIAGAYLHVRDTSGRLVREEHLPEHVRGGSRFYRRACLEAIAPLPQILGWDGADEVRARRLGWSTRSVALPGAASLHLRPTGTYDGRLRAHARWGVCAYAVGAHPLAVLGGAAMRARNPPAVLGALAYVLGWAAAAVRRAPRAPEDIRRAKRREQAARLRGALGRRVAVLSKAQPAR